MKKARAHVFVEGRVQGVFYRAWTQKEARKLGLTGWVKNLSDGRVEAVFEGSKDKVAKMVEKCEEGSSAAKPSFVDISWDKPRNELGEFVIKG